LLNLRRVRGSPKSGNFPPLTRTRARPETGNNLLDAVIGGGRPDAERDIYLVRNYLLRARERRGYNLKKRCTRAPFRKIGRLLAVLRAAGYPGCM
jgi:hypothetical protein